jgi:Ala-tRNA(Pro) deacylase
MKTVATVSGPLESLQVWLTERDVEFDVHEHDEAFSATSTALAEGVDARTFAKVVGVTTDDGRAALLVLDAQDRLDLEKADRALDAGDVRLLTESEFAALTPGCVPGAVPAVGALFGLPMVADLALRDCDEISFNAGTHRHSVRVDRAAWERATAVRYEDLAIADPDRPAWAS